MLKKWQTELQARPKKGQMIDKLIEQELSKVTSQVGNSMQQRQAKMDKHYPLGQQTKQRSHSLPFIGKQIHLKADRRLLVATPAILIDS